MVVGLGGGETIGYLVEYLNETQKDVSVVTPSFVREQAGIQAVIEIGRASCRERV